MVEIVHYPLCPLSRMVRLMLGEMNVDIKLVEEKPWEWRPDFLSLNPAGDVPVLIIDGCIISGIYAILEFLIESQENFDKTNHDQVEKQTLMLPHLPTERAETRRMTDWFIRKFDREVWQPLQEEKIEGFFLDHREPDPDLMRAALANMRNHLGYVNRIIEERYWLSGETMNICDLAACGYLSCLDYLGHIDWEKWPFLKSWYARIKSRPSFRPLLKDNIPGFVAPPHYADLDF